jgi:hypothetical protein
MLPRWLRPCSFRPSSAPFCSGAREARGGAAAGRAAHRGGTASGRVDYKPAGGVASVPPTSSHLFTPSPAPTSRRSWTCLDMPAVFWVPHLTTLLHLPRYNHLTVVKRTPCATCSACSAQRCNPTTGRTKDAKHGMHRTGGSLSRPTACMQTRCRHSRQHDAGRAPAWARRRPATTTPASVPSERAAAAALQAAAAAPPQAAPSQRAAAGAHVERATPCTMPCMRRPEQEVAFRVTEGF